MVLNCGEDGISFDNLRIEIIQRIPRYVTSFVNIYTAIPKNDPNNDLLYRVCLKAHKLALEIDETRAKEEMKSFPINLNKALNMNGKV